MENEKTKKKKLTLSVSSKKTHNAPHYVQRGRKTTVVIEKKRVNKWGEKKFQPRNNNLQKPKPSGNFFARKPQINRNFDIRKIAEERATKRIKKLEEKDLQLKKSSLAKDKGFTSKRQYQKH